MADEQSAWFTEACKEAGSMVGFRITDHLHHEQTPFQTIDIYATAQFGNLMVIDGFIMLTQRDNFLYHEMLTHPALFTHRDPRQVLIVGGGDCGTLREVLRHPQVERCLQVEIDERVTRLAETYFPELCEANSDPRAHLHFEDAIRYLAEAEDATLDLIIVDSTDPVGPAEGLFGPEFMRNCYRALGEGGIIVQQSESPLIHRDLIGQIRANMQQAGFGEMRTLCFPQPCYPSGWWSATMAGKNCALGPFRADDAEQRPFSTEYYNVGIHQGALNPPEFLRRRFDSKQ
ncbi:MAG: polyamine aminopropyltransferase [Wenzhouxiangellaceae bacterium]